MTSQPTLPVARDHDLPPFWDGLAVVWDGWQARMERVFVCPPPKPECCQACGSTSRTIVNRARVAISGIVTHAMVANEDAIRRRLPAGTISRRRVLALYGMHAFRCPDCRHDVVVDRDGQTWTLDESDYRDDGSWER